MRTTDILLKLNVFNTNDLIANKNIKMALSVWCRVGNICMKLNCKCVKSVIVRFTIRPGNKLLLYTQLFTEPGDLSKTVQRLSSVPPFGRDLTI